MGRSTTGSASWRTNRRRATEPPAPMRAAVQPRRRTPPPGVAASPGRSLSTCFVFFSPFFSVLFFASTTSPLLTYALFSARVLRCRRSKQRNNSARKTQAVRPHAASRPVCQQSSFFSFVDWASRYRCRETPPASREWRRSSRDQRPAVDGWCCQHHRGHIHLRRQPFSMGAPTRIWWPSNRGSRWDCCPS